MITLYSGTPGSGKSLHLANVIWEWLLRKKPIIANFPVDLDVIKINALQYYAKKIMPTMKIKRKRRIGKYTYVDMGSLTVEYLLEYAQKHHRHGREGQTLLIIDECAVIFNSRAWDAKDRSKWIVFFQQHRKLGYEIILVSQSDRLIDRQIRAFIEYDVKHRCVNNFTWFGVVVGLLAGGKFFAGIKYWYGVKEKCGKYFFRLNRRKASIYDSFMVFTADNKDKAEDDKGAPGIDPAGVPLSASA